MLRDCDADAASQARTSRIRHFDRAGHQPVERRLPLCRLRRSEQNHAPDCFGIIIVERSPARRQAHAIGQRLPGEERLPNSQHPKQQSHKGGQHQSRFDQRLACLPTRALHSEPPLVTGNVTVGRPSSFTFRNSASTSKPRSETVDASGLLISSTRSVVRPGTSGLVALSGAGSP